MSRYIMVSNRVTVHHPSAATSGGLAVAIISALKKSGGIWFGWSGDLSDNDQALNLEHREPITYATTDLSPQAFEDYYCGFSNSVLWPAFHYRMDLATYDPHQYESYRQVNQKWAQQLLTLLEPEDVIWVHDYHLIPFAHYCRTLGITNRIGFFLHIPFPSPEVFDAIPCGQDLLEDLCHYDLIGFHTESYQKAFLSCLTQAGSKQICDPHTVNPFVKHPPATGVYPIGVDVAGIRRLVTQEQKKHKASSKMNKPKKTIISVDRVDYTKGMPERFAAIEHFLESLPDYREAVNFIQIAPDSRQDIPAYQTLRDALHSILGRINHNFGTLDWTPLRCLNQVLDRQSLMSLLRQAHIGLVTPLRDGMNLIAKEFVAAQDPKDPGVLILSELAGAAEELEGALLVNPYDPAALALLLDQALKMPLEERKNRHQQMMNHLLKNDIKTWHERFWQDLKSSRILKPAESEGLLANIGKKTHSALSTVIPTAARSQT